MIYKATVVSKWDMYDDGFVYVDTLSGHRMRIDFPEFLGGKLPNVGDEVEVEKRGLYWIQATITRQLATNWKKEGF